LFSDNDGKEKSEKEKEEAIKKIINTSNWASKPPYLL
jgi:hypothetical protein